MTYLKYLLLIPMLLIVTACSQKTDETAVADNPKKALEEIGKKEAMSIDAAHKTLNESKQVEQIILNSDAQQREIIEKTEH